MLNQNKIRTRALVGRLELMGCAFLFFAAGGCFGPPDVPTELEVVLPEDARQTAIVNSGPEAFANSTWVVRRAADPANAIDNSSDTPMSPYGGLLNGGLLDRVAVDGLMFKGHFVDGGVATRVTDNRYYLPQQFGDELVIDGTFHGASLPGLAFAAVPFGVQVDNQIGFALPAEVRFVGLQVSKVIVYAWGTLNEAGDRLDGMFGYTADLSLIPELILGSGGDQYPFYATREP